MDYQEENDTYLGIEELRNSNVELNVQAAKSQDTADGHSTPSGTNTQDDKFQAGKTTAAAMAQEQWEREVDRLMEQLDYWTDILEPFAFYMDQVDPEEIRRADPELVRKINEKLDSALEVLYRLKAFFYGRPVLEDQGQ
ncbi:hypothetical protein GE09DRAFT_1209887 [Coniochaeta sp. 2T2.1]|nr:hypothetical protein GE09DRAFT_1209887 [Coniochaeta sp. 2T2.1]